MCNQTFIEPVPGSSDFITSHMNRCPNHTSTPSFWVGEEVIGQSVSCSYIHENFDDFGSPHTFHVPPLDGTREEVTEDYSKSKDGICRRNYCARSTLPLLPERREWEGEIVTSSLDKTLNENFRSELPTDLNELPCEASQFLTKLKISNKERIVFGHLNINHLQNKFEPLMSLVKDKLDLFLLTETKIDQSFTTAQFVIEGYSKPFRRDRDKMGGGLLLYVREDITCKEIKQTILPSDIECLFIEMNLRNKKYLIVGGYNPHKDSSSYFLDHVGKAIDFMLGNYDDILLMGDFNCLRKEQCMVDFCDTYDLINLIKEPTCFKNPVNPSSIDVMLTNRPISFQNSSAIETGLSDHHKLTVSVLKVFFKKIEPVKICYRSYKNFKALDFRKNLSNSLRNCNQDDMGYKKFHDIFMGVLNIHAPKRLRTIRGNSQPFMNETLSQAFMHRSKLKNTYNKHPTAMNKKNFKKHHKF